jgi:endonuclease/exonuclease/phosphatase family metal-dependent hydrolase
MIRFASYNVEWFNALFDDEGRLLRDNHPSGRHGVSRATQVDAIAHVLGAIDADAVMIIEAPDESKKRSTVKALEHFAEVFHLRCRAVAFGFANNTQQEIAFLYDPDVMTALHAPQEDEGAPQFDQHLSIDLDFDDQTDEVRFSKPPLELAVTTTSGHPLRLIGAHLKSKAPYGAKDAAEARAISIQNRRKQLAQAIWLRRRVDALLRAGQDVMVMGDLNDGPGLDNFEMLFGRSTVEIVQGAGETRLCNPFSDQARRHPFAPQRTTSRFFDINAETYLHVLLDYIFIGQSLVQFSPKWDIWHPFENKRCWQDKRLNSALLAASDHFPVTLDLDI